MSKDLINSALDRQNILNNPYALAEIEKAAGIRGIPFEGKTVVLKEQVALFFEVTLLTVENYLERNAEELARNGYEVVTGNRLKTLKLAIQGLDHPETDFGMIGKTARLGVLDFRAFLNIAMLMTESERAGLLRKAILDIVIDTINRRTGGAPNTLTSVTRTSFSRRSSRKTTASCSPTRSRTVWTWAISNTPSIRTGFIL